VHYFDAHTPYEATPWARARLEGYEGSYGKKVEIGRFGMGRWLKRPEDARAVHTLYDGSVRASDVYLSSLLAFLERRGLLKDTVVIVTADHGQALGEHDLPGHGLLWESILHVPLIVWDGRQPRAAKIEERVGLVDLAPTLLEIAGVEIPEGLHGRSLVPALRGEALAPRPYFGSVRMRDPRSARNRAAATLRKKALERQGTFEYEAVVYDGRLKLMVGPHESALFDVRADPGELSPLPQSDHASSYERMQSLLDEFQASAGPPPEASDVPEDVKEQLRALGYTE
jgi:arylsulfatase A-like enzyme